MEPVTGVAPVTMDASLAQQDNYGMTDGETFADVGTLGDKFFEMLSETKQQISQKSADIESALSVQEVSPADLLRLQYELAEIAIQQELISKGVSKSTQNVDTLLKAQ